MPGCALASCTNYNRNKKGKDIKYFRFPKNEDLANRWIVACRRKDKIKLKKVSNSTEFRILRIKYTSNNFEITLFVNYFI